MGTMNISVNMDRVQSSVNAAIRPAVETALAGIDVKAIILETLQAKAPRTDDMMWRYALLTSARAESTSTYIESMVKQGIGEIAKEFVASELAKQRGYIEEALRRMMTGSANRLVKAFGKAAERALEDDWSFELDVKVEHRVKESSSDD